MFCIVLNRCVLKRFGWVCIGLVRFWIWFGFFLGLVRFGFNMVRLGFIGFDRFCHVW